MRCRSVCGSSAAARAGQTLSAIGTLQSTITTASTTPQRRHASRLTTVPRIPIGQQRYPPN
jgi:hypothetical protein